VLVSHDTGFWSSRSVLRLELLISALIGRFHHDFLFPFAFSLSPFSSLLFFLFDHSLLYTPNSNKVGQEDDKKNTQRMGKLLECRQFFLGSKKKKICTRYLVIFSWGRSKVTYRLNRGLDSRAIHDAIVIATVCVCVSSAPAWFCYLSCASLWFELSFLWELTISSLLRSPMKKKEAKFACRKIYLTCHAPSTQVLDLHSVPKKNNAFRKSSLSTAIPFPFPPTLFSLFDGVYHANFFLSLSLLLSLISCCILCHSLTAISSIPALVLLCDII